MCMYVYLQSFCKYIYIVPGQGFIQDFEMGGRKHGGSRMIVARESTLTYV